jgi:autophagy-related protein 13
VELDETEEYRDEIRTWKSCDYKDHRPPPLVIEVFLNTEELTSKQSLVILDDQGKRWDVQEALASSGTRPGRRRRRVENEVILERWTIQLGEDPVELPSDLNSILPLVYKKSIVLFRSLFTYSAFLPAWKLSKKLAKIRSNSLLKLQYRIIDGTQSGSLSRSDNLRTPLCDSQDEVVSDYSFGVTESPAGSFSVKVTYRLNCEFSVDDSESLLSSRFMGTDDEIFRPSIPTDDLPSRRQTSTQEVGSLPNDRKDVVPRADLGQAYGSLSTFHNIGAASSTSPITALRNAHDLGSASPAASPPTRPIPSRRSNQSSRSSLRAVEGNTGVGRRSSISFQPFKTPSLSASPSLNAPVSSSPRPLGVRAPVLGTLNEARGMPPPALPASAVKKSLPTASAVENAVTSSASSSPKPAPITRYSSSFSHRHARLTSGGATKAEDDQGSSGKTSAASSANQPGSGLMADAAVAGNAASVHEDDENITAFITMLEQKRDLLTPADSSATEASTRRTAAALNRFHKMRDSNAALSDSLSMSLHRSSSSSSRQLSSVPPMVAATSASTSSSPGKPISPHTPHTPAIPSRLSANSIIDYSHRDPEASAPSIDDRGALSEEATSDSTVVEPAVSHVPPIDIPTSPRPFGPSYRRSSSVAQRRVGTDDEDVGELYGMRSASMGANRRTVSTTTAPVESQVDDAEDDPDQIPGRAPTGRRSSADYQRRFASGLQPKTAEGAESGSGSGSSSIHQVYRSRLARGAGAGRGATPPHGSESGGSGSFERRGGSRQSFSRPSDQRNVLEEDEPLFLPFAMSDIGASRRSLEEARAAAQSSSERDRGNDARRGSRRGGAYPWGS